MEDLVLPLPHTLKNRATETNLGFILTSNSTFTNLAVKAKTTDSNPASTALCNLALLFYSSLPGWCNAPVFVVKFLNGPLALQGHSESRYSLIYPRMICGQANWHDQKHLVVSVCVICPLFCLFSLCLGV